MPREAPQRTCISCRRSQDKSGLIRYVLAPDSTIVPDVAHKLPGRGIYTCVDIACVKRAAEKDLFSRSLKRPVKAPFADQLCTEIARCMEERISSYVALANKAGKIVAGSDMVMENLRKRTSRDRLVLLALDMSEDIGLKIKHLADVSGIAYYSFFDRIRLGELLGKGLRSAIVVQGEGFVGSLIREIERYRSLVRGEGCSL